MGLLNPRSWVLTSLRVSPGYQVIAQSAEWWTVVVYELLWPLPCVGSDPDRYPSVTGLNLVCKIFNCAQVGPRLDKESAWNAAHYSWAYVSYNPKDNLDISQRITKAFHNIRMLKRLWNYSQQDMHPKYMLFLAMICSQHDCYKAVAIHRKSGVSR